MNPFATVQHLLLEFRRRRMFRATAVYLGAAFVILQLADLVIEPLKLPAWTMSLVIVLAAVGFLLTLVLAWLFDITPEGLQRAGARVVAPPSQPKEGTARRSRSRRALVVATLLVVFLAGGWFVRGAWFAARGDTEATAIAVLPFRVNGTTGDVSYLREGMVDLLTSVFAERGGLATVSPRLLLRELDTDADAVLDDQTKGVLRRLGGALVVSGEVVGRPEHLTISAALQDIGTGAEVRAIVTGAEQELERLVDRLAAQLVARRAGAWVSEGSLNDVPLAALREYLEGLALQRHGRWKESADRMQRALTIDSTFAAAALAFDVAAGWGTAPAEVRDEVRDLAWRHRHRLGPLNRLQLEAILGPTYPENAAPAARLRLVEEGLAAMPDRPELWYLYGDILFHDGQAIGAPDWEQRSVAAFKRARSIAADHIESDYHLMELALTTGDTTLFRELSVSLLQRDTLTEMRGFIHGLLALHEDTPAAWAAYREQALDDGGQLLGSLMSQALTMTTGLEELLDIARALEARAVTPTEAAGPLSVQVQILANSGRTTEAMAAVNRRFAHQGAAGRQERLQLLAWVGFGWDGDTIVGRRAVEELRSLLQQQAAAGGRPPHPFMICTVGVIDLLHGRSDWAATALAWLERGAAEHEAGNQRVQARSCGMALRAGVAHFDGTAADRARTLAEFGAFLTERPFGATRTRAVANLLAIMLFEAAADLPAALAAAQRLQDRITPGMLSTAIREEGRLLERLGRHEEAARAYHRYLALRHHAEPRLRAADDRLRVLLAGSGWQGR